MEYKICLEQSKNLEVIKALKLQDNERIVNSLADFIFKFYKYGLSDIPYINKLAENLLTGSINDDRRLVAELTPDTLMCNELLGEDLAPWAKTLRKKLFGKADVPFNSYRKTLNWIEAQDASLTTCKFRRRLTYLASRGKLTFMGVRINSPLEKLIFASQRLEHELQIGLDWNTLVFYVLRDILPSISPWEILIQPRIVELPSGRSMLHQQATIIVKGRTNYQDFVAIYSKIREGMRLTKKKELNINHLKLYRMVKRKGGAPRGKGTVRFWKAIQREWNDMHLETQLKHWKSFQMTYNRMLGKLMDELYGASPR